MAVSRSPGYQVRRVGTLGDSLEQETDGRRPEPGAEGAAAEALPLLEDVPAAESSPGAGAAPGAGSLAPAGADRPHRWRSAARRAPGLALVAALGVAGTAGFGAAFALERGGGSPTPAIGNAARNLVLALTNFDPGTVGADFAQIQRDATGTFAGQARRFFGASIRKELTTADAASRGTVDDLYVQSVNGNHATVFAVVSQRYLNKAAGAPINDTLRLVLGMTDVGGTWKTSSVQVLQQPAGVPSAGSSSSPASGSGSGSHSGSPSKSSSSKKS